MTRKYRTSRDIIIRTKDYSKAVRFYGSVLGLKIFQRGSKMAGFESGSFCIYVEKGEEHGPVFEFLVPDVRAAKKKLVAAGCKVVEEDPALPRCYIRDPYGMVFNIGQAADG